MYNFLIAIDVRGEERDGEHIVCPLQLKLSNNYEHTYT